MRDAARGAGLLHRCAAAAAALAILVSVPGCAPKSARVSPVVQVVRNCADSVVNISTERVVVLQQNPLWHTYGSAFDEFFNQNAQGTISTTTLKGIGSGVIVSGDGLIVTNAHVVNMASKVYVILSDGTTYNAAVPAVSPGDDIAILKISVARKLKPIPLAHDIFIGETVVSIGNPFGLENSVFAGIISGTNRNFSVPSAGLTYAGLIQTDCPINIGASGGALLNLDGELVGLNLALLKDAQSIGFAIPYTKIASVLKQYDDYLKKQSAARPQAR